MMLRARKRFGQHFLRDLEVVARIVREIDPRPAHHIVEIGPGLGSLTRELLVRVQEMDAIELDRDLLPQLEQTCKGLGRLRVHNVDALKFDFGTLAKGGEKLRVVGNLPYNISSPLLFHLLAQSAIIKDMHFMLQKEVVDRITAEPGTKDYGRLTVMVSYRCRVEPLFSVGAEAFRPRPRVDSAVVRIIPFETLPVAAADEPTLAEVVRTAFSQRRKTLRNCLRDLVPAEAFDELALDSGRRPETLSVEEFVRISDFVHRARRRAR